MAKAQHKTFVDTCPCGSGGPYAQCCGALHAGQKPADAEALMRSRYAAYVLKNDAYLLESWHPDTRPDRIEHEPGTRWLGLKVLSHTVLDSTHAEVLFEARYRVGGGSAVRMRERSRFVLWNDRWVYHEGDLIPA